VLFSNEELADTINNLFEPVCETVREVPIVTIDFGGDHIVTRTLRGNIATYICDENGEVLDILPGIYDRATYLDQLLQLQMLANYLRQPAQDRSIALKEYHKRQSVRIGQGELPARLRRINTRSSVMSKTFSEKLVTEIILYEPQQLSQHPPGLATIFGAFRKLHQQQQQKPPADLSEWTLLTKDAQANESIGRLQVHDYLAERTQVQPHQMTKWLYKEVLHADLEDPYLGFGEQLFGSYPFRTEDGF
jgi:hypothetical protein